MDKLPESIATDTLEINGLKLVVHVLSDGRRVVDEDSVKRFIEWMNGYCGVKTLPLSASEAEELAEFISGKGYYSK